MDEVTISKAITQSFLKDFTEAMEVDVAIVGAGPSGLRLAWLSAGRRLSRS